MMSPRKRERENNYGWALHSVKERGAASKLTAWREKEKVED